MTERVASRATLLELRRERAVMEQGHRFLDEKRIALAQQLLRDLRTHAELCERLLAAQQAAAVAINAALEVHGLEGLALYPPGTTDWRVTWQESTFLGVRLTEAAPLLGQRGSAAAIACLPSAAAERCAAAFADLCRLAAPLAALEANLRRLADEFGRTQRRVRALEHVILPEARADERRMQALLDEQELEEIVRARLFAASPSAAGWKDRAVATAPGQHRHETGQIRSA